MVRNVAILIFNDVEVLDFAGPFEVFGVTGRNDDPKPFNVYTVAESTNPVLARNALSINPHYSIHDCPTPQIIVVPGGWGTRREMNNPVLLDWIKQQAAQTELNLSVCTGALMFAKADLLEGLTATTHFGAINELRAIAPNTTVLENTKYVDNGTVITSAGISAGINMSLYVVGKLLGIETAIETARYMEYDWEPDVLPDHSRPNHS